MQYVLLFLEGVITFISPCLLPMLPVYVSYFAGGGRTQSAPTGDIAGQHSCRGELCSPVPQLISQPSPQSPGSILPNAIGFVLGFTIIFVALGAFAGSIGRLLLNYATAVNIITGLVVIFFGLNYMGVLAFLGKLRRQGSSGRWIARASSGRQVAAPTGIAARQLNFPSAVLFGAVFSIGWTPCVSAFLGAALLRASQQGSAIEGMLMLFVYSLGLGLPFIASAVLIHRLKNAFAFIQRHYRVINILSGGLLVIVGILMMTGLFGRFMSLLA